MSKAQMILTVLILVLSCASTESKSRQDKSTMIISFGSVYDDERLTLSINDSVYFNDTKINTNSPGTDPNNIIKIAAKSIHLKGSFKALMDPDFDKSLQRTIMIDTLLEIKNGRRIIIGANYDRYFVSQQNKLFKVE